MPRVLAPAVLLLWVSMPWVTRRLTRGQDFGRWTVGRWAGGALAVLAIVLVFASGWWITWTRWDRHGQVAQALPTPAVGIPVSAGDWRYYGRDQESGSALWRDSVCANVEIVGVAGTIKK